MAQPAFEFDPDEISNVLRKHLEGYRPELEKLAKR